VRLLRVAGNILRIGEDVVFIFQAAARIRKDEFVGKSVEFDRVCPFAKGRAQSGRETMY
jgi:hypothetical protein